jgi:hypothetical protein
MARIESRESVLVTRPAASVFAYIQDLEREHEWQVNLLEAYQLTPGPVQIGTRRRYVTRVMGRRVCTTYVVTALTPDREIVYETIGEPSTWSRWHIECEPVDARTRVAMHIEAEVLGFLRLIPRIVLVATARRELLALLASLRERVETTASRTTR